MGAERILLLWDDLDDLLGAARHLTLNAAGGVAGAGRDAVGHVGGWLTTGAGPATSLVEVAPET
jgi:hypothetical protein